MQTGNSEDNFEPGDNIYWEQPGDYALTKENDNGVGYYGIFGVARPTITMLVIDDFEYAVRLANKMIENGVRIFEDFKSLQQWHQQKHSTGDQAPG
jgi:hypothetical protein